MRRGESCAGVMCGEDIVSYRTMQPRMFRERYRIQALAKKFHAKPSAAQYRARDPESSNFAAVRICVVGN